MEINKADLVIVYDKYTETAANGFSGGLVDYKYTCLVQKDTVFESKKNSYTNNNKILFLSENLIGQYLSMSHKSDYVIDTDWGNEKIKIYFYLYSLGNWRGIWIDMEKTAKYLPAKYKWRFYTLRATDYNFAIWTVLINGRRFSKSCFDEPLYMDVIKFLLKKENIKLIISD